MTEITTTTATTLAPSPAPAPAQSAYGQLGQKDFLRLLTVQVQQQDPFNPVDNKDMLAQLAQFSSLAGITEMSETLKQIAARLDAIEAGNAAARALEPTPLAETQIAETQPPQA